MKCDEVKYFIIFFSICRAAIGQAVRSPTQATGVLDRGELNKEFPWRVTPKIASQMYLKLVRKDKIRIE